MISNTTLMILLVAVGVVGILVAVGVGVALVMMTTNAPNDPPG